jgi:hypothetical protein
MPTNLRTLIAFAVLGLLTACGGGSSEPAASATGTHSGASAPSGSNPGGSTSGSTTPSAPSTGGTTLPAAQACDKPTPWALPTALHVVGDGTAASCTATALAQAVSAGGTITFNCGTSNVVIPVTKTIEAPGGTTTVIDGGGKVTLDGGGTTRILVMAGAAKLSVRKLALQNGYLAESNLYGGAAIGPTWGNQLEILNSSFSGNYAPRGGGGAVMAGSGGALTIVDSTFTNNSGPYGAAVYNLLAPLTIVNTTFYGNHAKKDPDGNGGNGAAIVTDGAGGRSLDFCGAAFIENSADDGSGSFMWTYAPDSVSIKKSTFRDNVARGVFQGGAALIVTAGNCDVNKPDCVPTPGSITIEDSTFATNTTDTVGGALSIGCFGPCAIKNSTFYGNSAAGGGAAITANQGLIDGTPNLRFNNVTFAHNGDARGTSTLDGKNFVLENTVFQSNGTRHCSSTENTGRNVFQFNPMGTSGAAADALCIATATAMPALDPFPAIADNGGGTFTTMPAPNAAGTLLIGAGSGCETKDQRGVARNTAKCTVGAVEVPAP